MRRRTEQIGIEFVDGLVKDWAFGVVDAFRTNLDIRADQRIDSGASKAKEQLLGRKLQPNEKVFRRVWTRGVPPAYSFDRGHMFHEPPEAHKLSWDEALPILRRTITVLAAQADAGALIDVLPQDDDSEDTSIKETAESSGKRGWVEIEILHYAGGAIQRKEKTVMFQSAFAEFLRTGEQALEEPAPAAIRTIEQALQLAIERRELVHLVYNGGSYPGEERPLIPIRLNGDQLIAKEPATNDHPHTFFLRKIASVALKDGSLSVNDDAEGQPERRTPYFASLDQYTEYLKPKFEAAGWHVHSNPELLGVGRRTKDGKPRKHPVIAIKFADRTKETKLDIHSGELFTQHKELNGRERPWRVETEREQAKAFGDLQKAVEFFASQVDESNPAKAPV